MLRLLLLVLPVALAAVTTSWSGAASATTGATGGLGASAPAGDSDAALDATLITDLQKRLSKGCMSGVMGVHANPALTSQYNASWAAYEAANAANPTALMTPLLSTMIAKFPGGMAAMTGTPTAKTLQVSGFSPLALSVTASAGLPAFKASCAQIAGAKFQCFAATGKIGMQVVSTAGVTGWLPVAVTGLGSGCFPKVPLVTAIVAAPITAPAAAPVADLPACSGLHRRGLQRHGSGGDQADGAEAAARAGRARR